MANRIVRGEILTSDSVNSLTWTGEVFYRRLMSVVDDYGRYDGRPSIIRGSLYSLKLDKVSESDVIKWMDECSEAGLVRLYQVENKPYIEILKFGQVLRIKKSKYPECITHDKHTYSIRTPETETNPKQETESETKENSHEKFLKVFEEAVNSMQWIQGVAMQQKKDYKFVYENFVEFLKELELKDDFHKGLKEIRSHFINWLKIQISKEKNSAKKENGTTKTESTTNAALDIASKRGWLPVNNTGEGDSNSVSTGQN